MVRDSWNAAIRDARGEFVAFLEPACNWPPERLEIQMAKFTAEPFLDWCYCCAASPPADTLRHLMLGNFIAAGSVVVRRSALSELCGFDESEEISGSEDWDLWLRLAGSFAVGVVREDRPSVLPQKDISIEKLCQSRRAVIERAVARDPHLKDLRSAALAEICIAAGIAYIGADRRKEARDCFAEALTHNPLRSDAYVNWMFTYDLSSLAAVLPAFRQTVPPQTDRAFETTRRR